MRHNIKLAQQACDDAIADALTSAHRASYLVFRGALRGSLQIDHLCCNKSCVNPDHLEQVTVAVNIQRGRLARMAPRIRALRAAKRCIDCGTAAAPLLRCNACDSKRQQAANARSFLKKMLGVELRATVDARARAAGVSAMEYVAAIVRATVQP